ncbi:MULTISPECIES: sodium/glutamate symporter [unclassified Capnocytophaga]|uniref:sodium/glutamate symporter n=1 Tax=unclassified Capnocytophaga TaxID=2640652 RepID=UPI000202BFBE|nr:MULTISPECIES: sodium/glutamate symporter [unclassified Capnocytophaga]EGD35259.1 ESS family glutamate:sodium (Na+) symporter [Capnocytophaga sp. oral taxon 338 str. F0234]MEB3003876.1 sodium/glutamate symporter [Capnocytophaga sp. G2]
MNTIIIDSYYTLIIATLVLLLGRFLVSKIQFLQNFNIPEPVAGGLLAAFIIYILYMSTGLSFSFNEGLQDTFMLIFFSSIGLSADFSRLKAGGVGLFIFLAVVALFIVVQNIVGVSLAATFGLKPIVGLMTGSITLTGGHGTAGAWGKVLEQKYNITGATDLGMAAATFGLVLGGLIGGPVARRLVNKIGKKPLAETGQEDTADTTVEVFEHPEKRRLITSKSVIETMALFAACLSFSALMTLPEIKAFFPEKFTLPQFVWALFFGVILRNVLTSAFKVNMFDRAIDVFGNASLSLFLGIALLNLKLWQLLDLALPMLVILAVQTFVMSTYAYFVTYRLMGKDYDAAVLAAGHCGFGLGATPTAVANMQSVTERFGPSHKAFLIVPMVGAFFVDFINAFILTTFISILT